jgi:hypothetical protein
MRRVIAAAVAVGALAGAPADAGAPSLSISRQEAPAPAFAHAAGVGANLLVRGRAAKGASVTVTADCARVVCTTSVTADRRGRWRAVLELVLPAGAATVRVTAASGAQERSAQPRLGAVTPPPGAGPDLVVIGDSLAEGVAPLLGPLLPGWRVTTHARTGRFLAQGMSILERTAFGARRAVLAFSLFTNDDPRRVDALDAAVRRALAAAGPGGCVVWATIRRPRLAGVSYGAANARLRALAAGSSDPRLVLVPWAETVARSPRLLGGDRVHPTTAGYARRAELFAAAAQQCQAAPPPGGVVAPGG